jgi:hypothetical protein
VNYHSSLAGTARLRVERNGTRVADVAFTATAGAGRVRMPRRPSKGDYRLTLAIDDGARTTTARLGVSTRRRLDMVRVRAVLRAEADQTDGDAAEGTISSLSTCVVHAPRRLDCKVLLTGYDASGRGPTHCAGILSARQRADGVRIAWLGARRGSHCREPAA